MAEPSKNDLIANRYSVLYTLGKGGMGVVLRCRDIVLQRDVAVKVLGDSADMDTAKRFQTEARATAKLQHENILQVMDFGETDGRLFLVMDYLDGITLADLIREKKRVAPEVAIPIFLQICDGLAHAHKKGVLHRDIKPSNIMLIETESGWIVKIVDFGIAKISTNADQKLTTTGTVVGSPLYLSPEAGLGKKCDLRSDIYSLGCLMFETLTGKPPFHGDTAFETIMMHANDAPPTISNSAGMSFDSHLELLIEKCIAKQPAKRYRSIDELGNELSIIHETINTTDSALKQDRSSDKTQAEPLSIHKPNGSNRKTFVIVLIVLAGLIGSLYIYKNIGASTRVAAPPAVFAKEVRVISVDNPPMDEHVVQQKFQYNDLSVKVLDPAVTDDQVSEVATQYSKATNWRMQGAKIKGPCFKTLQSYPIQSFELKQTLIDGKALETISKMKSVSTLDIRKCRNIRPEDLRHLATMASFEIIQLSLPKDPEGGLKMIRALSKVNNIRVLTIDEPELTNEMVTELERMTNLTQLQASFSSNDSATLGRTLGELPALTKLMSTNAGLNEIALKALASRLKERKRLENIVELQIELPENSKQAIDTLKVLHDFPNLRYLQLDCNVNAALLNELSKFPRLKIITLPNDYNSDDFKQRLARLRERCQVKTFKTGRVELF